ncbi:hypothetical protein [Tropicimonas sp. IMCC6043]|uniref:hypothetical protein n=1 Tax=Tropicimonas sp. IMCC6043 TaxID=2510645 RepID=UPI00101C447E|nr:hypothetical protein [Tropicimonas sp. IMCC6043]RYH07183.1 hypothetical protein EU800_21170 [Tropicimonas sp. IMCC6043]
MFLSPRLSVVIAGCAMALGGEAFADEEMDRILDEAMPYMHHSCESVIANYGEDEEKVAEIVRLIAEVSLFNREINVEEAVPDAAERDGLKDKFVAALEDTCETDPDALLAGAVDMAVKDALD